MKSLRKILFSIIMILVLTLNYVNAAEPEVQITGDSEAKAGETKTLILKIVSDEDIGIFSGKLTKDANIDDVILEEKNNWDLISGENGTFKLMKPQGAKKEDVLAITYKIKEGATGKANITISSIDLTTIEYETKKATDISKDISIKEEAPVKELSNIEITKAPNKTSYKAGESFDKTGIEITAKYSDGTTKVITNYTYAPKNELSEENTKITISYTENGVTKTAEQKIIVEKKVVIDGNNNNDNNNNNNNNNPSNSGNANNGSSNNNANNNGSTNNNSQNPVIVIGKGEGKDTTVANKELAKAGATHITLYAALGMIALGIVFYKKYTSI